ncbi:lariat debranching enzyme [Cenococcum geophilum]
METPIVEKKGLRIAVEGCGHGTLHSIYASIQKTCEIQSWDGVDLLIIGGDFQAVRNAQDLNVVSMPAKYREIGDFHEYYSGARVAPYLTVFVGGNHEASNYLWELYYGGWAAPNIYYMGAASVVRLGPLRIAGLSGIWKGYNYKKPHYERLPYNQDDIKSIYHVRELDIRKLLQIRTQVDIAVSHDWPRGIEWKGNWRELFRKKSHFEAEAREGSLGSVAAKYVLDRLRPAYWFSAHMHIKYSATLEHEYYPPREFSGPIEPLSAPAAIEPVAPAALKNEEEIDLDMDDIEGPSSTAAQAAEKNQDEIHLDLEDDDNPLHPKGGVSQTSSTDIPEPDSQNGPSTTSTTEVPQDLRDLLPASFARSTSNTASARPKPNLLLPPADIKNKTTYFLALDKCLPNRDFLQLLDIEPLESSDFVRPMRLEYDREWLAITRVFAKELILGDPDAKVPFDKGDAHYLPLIEQEETWVEENVVKTGKMVIPEDFEVTATPYDTVIGPRVNGQPQEYNNPHTKAFCDLLQMPNPFEASEEEVQQRMRTGPRPNSQRGRDNFRGGSSSSFERGGRGGHRGRGRGRGGGRGGYNSNMSAWEGGRGR